MIDHHAALIYAIVIASAADSDMTDIELARISEIVSLLPAFKSFDLDRLPDITNDCAALLADEDGLEKAFDAMHDALPELLHGARCREDLLLGQLSLQLFRHGVFARLSARLTAL